METLVKYEFLVGAEMQWGDVWSHVDNYYTTLSSEEVTQEVIDLGYKINYNLASNEEKAKFLDIIKFNHQGVPPIMRTYIKYGHTELNAFVTQGYTMEQLMSAVSTLVSAASVEKVESAHNMINSYKDTFAIDTNANTSHAKSLVNQYLDKDSESKVYGKFSVTVNIGSNTLTSFYMPTERVNEEILNNMFAINRGYGNVKEFVDTYLAWTNDSTTASLILSASNLSFKINYTTDRGSYEIKNISDYYNFFNTNPISDVATNEMVEVVEDNVVEFSLNSIKSIANSRALQNILDTATTYANQGKFSMMMETSSWVRNKLISYGFTVTSDGNMSTISWAE